MGESLGINGSPGAVCPYHGKTAALLESALKVQDHHEDSLKEITKNLNEVSRACSFSRKACTDELEIKRNALEARVERDIDEVRAEVVGKVPQKLFYVLVTILVVVCGFLFNEQRQTNSTLTDIKVVLEGTVREMRYTKEQLDNYADKTDEWRTSIERRLNRENK